MLRRTSAHLIFNPGSGDTNSSAQQLADIVATCQAMRVETSVREVQPGVDVALDAKTAAHRGARYVIASGGDNTIDAVASGLVGTRTTLVIVPTGTRNNVARALNIPLDVAEATRLLREGERTRVDMGRVRTAAGDTFFLELVAVGLGAALFPDLDEAQKGNIGKVGDLLATLISHPASTFKLNLDRGKQKLRLQALTMAVLNMPFLGANFQLADDVDCRDGLLDVFMYADLGKLDLLTHAVQVARGYADDPRVKHFRVKQLTVETDPPLSLMVDGETFEAQQVEIRRLSRALRVMAPKTV